MTVALIVVLAVSTAGFLVLLDRKDGRDREERQMLLQRIQAPEAAVVDYGLRSVPDDPSGFPQSDNELAEAEERARVIQFIERHEG